MSHHVLLSKELLVSSLTSHLPSSLLKTGFAHHKRSNYVIKEITLSNEFMMCCGLSFAVEYHLLLGLSKEHLSLFGENEGLSESYYLALPSLAVSSSAPDKPLSFHTSHNLERLVINYVYWHKIKMLRESSYNFRMASKVPGEKKLPPPPRTVFFKPRKCVFTKYVYWQLNDRRATKVKVTIF